VVRPRWVGRVGLIYRAVHGGRLAGQAKPGKANLCLKGTRRSTREQPERGIRVSKRQCLARKVWPPSGRRAGDWITPPHGRDASLQWRAFSRRHASRRVGAGFWRFRYILVDDGSPMESTLPLIPCCRNGEIRLLAMTLIRGGSAARFQTMPWRWPKATMSHSRP